ncbi:MAG: D-tyrosyl-tRNA(Tyr) deacylase [Bacteroidetes bacterium]|nr:D-tyrosyl-tRNA(Tyr) deacylase [Bacteroidota bacterium]
MRVVIQRVKEAKVTVDGKITGEIGSGLMILLGVHQTDTKKEADWLTEKISKLRIFPDADGKMNISGLDAGADFLVVSQFTLYGDAQKGNRPSFIESAQPGLAEPLYEYFCEKLEQLSGKKTQKGIFGAMMDVHLINDGPVTILLDSPRS